MRWAHVHSDLVPVLLLFATDLLWAGVLRVVFSAELVLLKDR